MQSSEPEFLLPGTLEAWKEQERAAQAACASQDICHRKAVNRLQKSLRQLALQSVPKGSSAKDELERRKLRQKREKLEQLLEEKNQQRTEQLQRRENPEHRIRILRQQEYDLIANTGTVLCRSSNVENKVVDYLHRPRGNQVVPVLVERRLVLMPDGRIFLCAIESVGIMASRMVDDSRNHIDGPMYDYSPSGEYRPPVVKWVTDSLAQMTDKELRVISAHEERNA